VAVDVQEELNSSIGFDTGFFWPGSASASLRTLTSMSCTTSWATKAEKALKDTTGKLASTVSELKEAVVKHAAQCLKKADEKQSQANSSNWPYYCSGL